MIINTKYPLAYESHDYITPDGAIHDDNVNIPYIEELESHFKRSFSYLELGCAGGGIIKYLFDKGHDAYGLEGTDHPIRIGRYAWKEFHNTRLFTCDLSKPFEVLGAPKFDVISNWEFFEHIPTESLKFLISKIYTLLNEDGMVICGISSNPATPVTPWHVSPFKRDVWEKIYFSDLFDCYDYPFKNTYRAYPEDIESSGSFLIMLKPKKNMMELAQKTIQEFNNKFL